MHDIESMRKRFPDMEPVETVPSLNMVNGFGFTVFGERGHDPQTNTYVTTVFLCILFMPVFAFGSYRVADNSPATAHMLGRVSSQSWRFYGRVPMSWLAKGWNFLVLGVIASLILMMIFTNPKP